jgi:hypothetical protein
MHNIIYKEVSNLLEATFKDKFRPHSVPFYSLSAAVHKLKNVEMKSN